MTVEQQRCQSGAGRLTPRPTGGGVPVAGGNVGRQAVAASEAVRDLATMTFTPWCNATRRSTNREIAGYERSTSGGVGGRGRQRPLPPDVCLACLASRR
jgi:hypothetical protein